MNEEHIDRLARLAAMAMLQSGHGTIVEKEDRVEMANALSSSMEHDELASLAANALDMIGQLESLFESMSGALKASVDNKEELESLHSAEAKLLRKLLHYAPRAARTELAQRGGNAKKANSEKTEAKDKAFALWTEWDAGKRPQLRTTEQFATEVMRQWPQLKSAKVICGWSARWRREARARRTTNPPC